MQAQSISYAKQIIDTLASETMHGRGYVGDGNKKAAIYIEHQFEKIGLQKFGKSYFQNLNFPVNIFPGKMEIKIDDKKLIPGEDYIVIPVTASTSGTFPILLFNDSVYKNPKAYEAFQKNNFSNAFILVDDSGIKNKDTLSFFERLRFNPFHAKGVIVLRTKLTEEMSQYVEKYALIETLRNKFPVSGKNIFLDIQTKFLEKCRTQNVIGFVKGTQYTDSFIVFSAHYDHLGEMGKNAYFPGASDNASGVAMLLNLANYFSAHPLKCSVVFMAFTGEEVGLLGSKYYTEHPLFPLSEIKILVNMDMVGTGEEGITVVNGSIFKTDFDLLSKINSEKNYLLQVKIRGEAANSDHYYFSKKNVKAVFVYTMGGSKAYHDVFDKPALLSLAKFENLAHLLIDFATEIQ
ncbi:MAG: M28 family peptidase [Bacteroidia bacterium]